MSKIKIKFILIFVCVSTITNAQSSKSSSKDYVKMGGAFRYNYTVKSWDKTNKDKGGEIMFDTFILNAKGQLKGIDFAVECRHYAPSYGGFMLHNGYIGIPLSQYIKLKLGMPRTPFGLLPYTSNNFFFNMPYYIGFEDDADFGGLLEYKKNNWEAQLSFAKNAEDVFSQNNKRYAYDISGNNREINQLTGRTAYHWGKQKEYELGYSIQYGQIYNVPNKKNGYKYAMALHSYIKKGKWDIKAQALFYNFLPKDSASVNYITMGAFAADYKVAKKGTLLNLSIAYTLPINHRLLKDIKFYNDFSTLNKGIDGFEDSYMNVVGCMLHTGPVYMLIDYVFAKNHAWIGSNYNNALFSGNENKWHKRFNINLGLYF